jgi:hypothetical protein
MTRTEIVPPCPDDGQAVHNVDERGRLRHPMWCTGAEKAPLGRGAYVTALAEPGKEHVGRDYCLETTDFDDTLTVTPVQIYDVLPCGRVSESPSQVRLSILSRDMVSSGASTHLAAGDVDRLIAMLTRAKQDLAMGSDER